MNKSSIAALAAAAALTLVFVRFAQDDPDRTSLDLVPLASRPVADDTRSGAVLPLVETDERSARTVQAAGPTDSHAVASKLPEAPLTGAVQLRVTDQLGRPMSQSAWMLIDASAVTSVSTPARRAWLMEWARFRAHADDLGIARFERVPAGEWAVVPQFDGVTSPLYPIHTSDYAIEVAAGVTTHVDLEVARMAVIHGFVHDADGRSEVAWLRATTYSLERGHALESLDGNTERDGTFRIFVPAGRVCLQTKSSGEAPVLGGVVAPPAQWFDLTEGATQYAEFVYGAGEARVFGRVVDQHEQPWEGLRAKLFVSWTNADGVAARYGTRVGNCVVDDSGSFAFEGVPEGQYMVSFEHPKSDFPARGGLAEYPVAATLTSDGVRSTDVGTSLVYRWENVRVEGFVSRTGGGSTDGLRLRVEIPPWNRITEHRTTRRIERRARIDAEGRFTFDYSAHVPGELIYLLDGASGGQRTIVPFDVGEARVQALTLVCP